MHELIIPLKWEYLDGLLEHINTQLINSRFPTILRLRAQAVVEELFYSLLSFEDVQTARLRCTYPTPQSIMLQYRNEKGALTPDLAVSQRFLSGKSTYGIKAEFSAGSCTITVGEK